MKLVLFPNKVLRVRSGDVKGYYEGLDDKLKEFDEILKRSKGVGLSANQAGETERFFAIRMPGVDKTDFYINPVIEKFMGKKGGVKTTDDEGREEDFLEGCLSFPDLWGTVNRYLKLEVSWDAVEKEKLVRRKKQVEGFEAVVFQHELDHLEGVLFVDRILEEGGKFYKGMADKMIGWKVSEIIDLERR